MNPTAALLFLSLWIGGISAGNAAEPRVVTGPLVVSDRWPECTTLATWTRDVLRLEKVEQSSETAQARAFFEWLRLFSRMAVGGMIQAFEGDCGREQYVLDAHKNLFVYGWGYCDTHSRIAEAAWSEYRQDRQAAQRVIVQHEDGGYHTMYRLRLDGRYAAFDARYGYFLIEEDSPGARILDWVEVGADENILKNKGYRNRSRPFFEFFGREWDRALLVQPRFFDSEEAWVRAGKPVECPFADPKYEMGTVFHDMSFRLPRGSRLERHWDNRMKKFYVPAGRQAQREEKFLPSGRFYRVTESMFDGNWPKNDPNYARCAPYLSAVPEEEGYSPEVRGGRTLGQAWGRWDYVPDLGHPQFLADAPVETDWVTASSAPFLRPRPADGGGQATFDFYCPYVLVDAVLEGEWAGGAGDRPLVEIRTLQPKTGHEKEPDRWTPWEALCREPGAFREELGRPRFNGRQVSLHGVYRFQLRFSLQPNAKRSAPAGLKRLQLSAWFENGIMAIPRIFPGENRVSFKVADAGAVRGPIRVTYRYQTAAGEKEHLQVIRPSDFQGAQAGYRLAAPGLQRCNSLIVEY